MGEEPVDSVVRGRDARLLLLASDAADHTRRRCEHFAEAGQCLWLSVPYSKDELGRAVGRSSAAVLALTDTGLAAAVVRRLAAIDPARYDQAAARMELKVQRAAQRRAAPRSPDQSPRRKEHHSGKAPSPPPRQRPETRRGEPAPDPRRPAKRPSLRTGGPSGKGRTAAPYLHSRPVKKGKGSFRKRDG